MVSSTINLEVMSRVATQRIENCRGRNGIQRRDTIPVKYNGSKTSSFFKKVGKTTSTSSIEHNSAI